MKSQGTKKSGKKGIKVFVGMSGGVDSSVSAALLKKAGYDVTGVFIKVWQPDWIECTWREERREAMRAAAHLGIPFITLDLEKEYKEGVIDYMISEYKIGRTPNPDVMCNREVKFGAFWKWAKGQGAEYVATGHYARVQEIRDSRLEIRFGLFTGKDKNKDQSYFLWTLNQDDLKHIMFPIGHLEKPEVRALAKKFGLPNAEKKDSQGLCFIGKIDVKDFLAHYVKQSPGNVLNEKGEVIGTHPGALLITLGERHGFTIDAKYKTPNDERYYVISKNIKENTITVSNRNNQDTIINNQIKLTKVSWTNVAQKVGEKIQIRVRYRQPLVPAVVKSVSSGQSEIMPESKIDAVTPGQSLVMYDGLNGEECLGGGVIE